MNQQHYINGLPVNPPKNYQELSIEVILDNDSQERRTSITTFEWVEKEAEILQAIIASGLSGGSGIFTGALHTIVVFENGKNEVFLDGYIDLTTATFGADQYGTAFVSADSAPISGLDWIDEVADGFTFEWLYLNGFLNDNDVVFVPYVISSIPNYADAFLVILSLTFVILELKRLISDLTQKTTESATYIDSVGGVVGLVFKIIFAILLLATIVELLLDLAALIIQKIKYHPSMSINRQIEAACNHLGLQYSSSILQNDVWSRAYILPERFSNPETQSDSRIKGFFQGDTNEQKGYYNGTLGDLLRGLKEMFNARIVMGNKSLKIEPMLKTGTGATFKIPPIYKPEVRTNADKAISNYLVQFRYDTTDKNTIDSWEGNNVQVINEAVVAGNPRLSLLKGFKRVSIPFARGLRKNNLNDIEKIVDSLLDAISPIIGVLISIGNAGIKLLNFIFKQINKVTKALRTIGIKIQFNLPEYDLLEDPNLDELIDNRIGMLKLESDYFTVPKIVLLDVNEDSSKTKVSRDNEEKVSASYLYDNYHITNSFAPSSVSAQRYIKTFNGVEMNLKEFKEVSSSGLAKLSTGEVVEVVSCDWNVSKRLANIEVHQRQLYTNNLRERKIIPKGR